MNKKRKVFIIAIDGGTWDVLNPLIANGEMPFLKKLVESGNSGILKSTIPPISPTAWASFQTGVNPNKHGIFGFVNIADGKNMKIVNSYSIKIKTIWQYLSENNKKIILINVPITYPPQIINGYMISGFLTPSIKSNFTYPKELKEKLLSRVKGYNVLPLGDIKRKYPNIKKVNQLIDLLIHMINKRAEVAKYMMDNYDWDIFMIYFQESDILQHKLWCYLDKSHALFNEEKYNIVTKYYKKLDILLANIYKCIPPQTPFIIISDHGFQAHNKIFYLNNWLCKEGFLISFNQKLFNKTILTLIKLLKNIDILRLRDRILNKEAKINMRNKLIQNITFDWIKSKAYSLAEDLYGCIYLIGESNEREKVRNVIIRKLEELKDPETEKKIVNKIYILKHDKSDDSMKDLPDIIIKPEDGYSFLSTFPSDQIIRKVNPKQDFNLGYHSEDGIFIFNCNNIVRNANAIFNIIDIAPTIIYYLGCPVPSYMEGRVLKEIFSKNFITKNPLSYKYDIGIKQFDKESYYSIEEEKKIKERLKSLGYLG